MKKIIGLAIVAFLGTGTVAQAQSRAKKATQEVKQGAKKAGNKTAEVASKGKSKVVDQQLKGKTGPNNETIYIDNRGQYYWVDKKGKKHYIAESSLKTKVD